MTVPEKFKFIRNDLKMSQEAFGETMGVSRDVINNFERGRVEIKEYMLRLVCKVHNVNYFWLTEDKGEPYLSPPPVLMADVIEKYGLDETDQVIIEEYVKLKPESRLVIKELIKNVTKNAPE